MQPLEREMNKPTKEELKEFERLERFYRIKGDGIAELKLEEALKSEEFKTVILDLFDANLAPEDDNDPFLEDKAS